MNNNIAQNDLRVIRTRQRLEAALIEMMTKKELSKISVKELCDIAQLSRKTFYDHYSDIYHLMEHTCGASAEALFYLLTTGDYDLHTANEMRQFFIDRVTFAVGGKVAFPLPANYEHYLCSTHRITDKLFIERRRGDGTPYPAMLRYIVEFITSGIIGVYSRWYSSTDHADVSMESIYAELFQHITALWDSYKRNDGSMGQPNK